MGLLNDVTQQQYYQGDDFGNYQFTSLNDVISQFMIVYVGEDKIIPKARRLDVAFHAQRAMQELSFDTFKSCKSQEITLPSSLQMTLPQDYVNYTKVSWVDGAGIKHLLYPTSKTSNPNAITQDADNGIYSPIISAYNQGFATDETNIVYDTGITSDLVNNQADFTAAAQFKKLWWTMGTGDVQVGRTYTLTYTISNVPYVDPSSGTPVAKVTPVLNDEYNNRTFFSARSENGTYTQTVNHNVNVIGALTSKFFIHVASATPFTGSISDVVLVESTDLPLNSESTSWSNYKSGTPSENQNQYDDDTYWPMDGSRFGLDPQHAQANGSFYIDCNSGKIHFSSNIAGKTVVLDYISDSLGTDGEMQVHKFAEEAMYKWISHAVLASKANTPEYLVARYKKERFAAIRTAKLRLSNIKLEEITQILRGKSKQIKH